MGSSFDRLLADAKAGSPVALGALYRQFNPGLCRFLVARLPSEGEDLAADVWVAVAPKIREFSGDERGFRAWLFTIAHRRLIDHSRRRGRRGPIASLREGQDQAAIDDPEAEALAHLEAVEVARLLLAHLTSNQCDVLMLRLYGGLYVSEVAAAMDQTEAWVRVTQHRALQRFSRRLGVPMEVTR